MKKVAVFTGNRSEYGLQLSALRAINNHPELEYKLIVAGAHLDDDFGQSINEIHNDGFRIDATIKVEMNADSLSSNVQSIGNTIVKIGVALEQIKPDFLIVYGDRSEALAAVIASTQMNIPTGHIEGGDLTEGGALDDSVRHAMTKLCHLHFTTNQQSANRVLGMGEELWRIHNVGLLSLDMIIERNFATPEEISVKLGINLSKPIVLFTQHSVATEFNLSGEQIKGSINALKKLAKKGIQVIITYPSNDAGGRSIIDNLQALEKQSISGIQIHKSLGRYLYHGVLALAQNKSNKVACVGNSSSGIKETPIFHCPTVNIGSRQSGRLRGQNIIDVDYIESEIVEAILLCFESESFRKSSHETNNPYYSGDSGYKIAEILSKIDLNNKLIQKKMTLNGEINANGWFR